MVTFNTTSGTTPEQSERLLKMGLKPETADLVLDRDGTYFNPLPKSMPWLLADTKWFVPAWSLSRLVAIAFDQSGPESVIHLYRHSNAFEDVMAFLDYQIEAGLIKAEYLKQ